jgi:predicted nucleic acid-binding protein
VAVLDASVVLAAVLPQDPNHETSKAWIDSLIESRDFFSAPSIILSEIAAPLSREFKQPEQAKGLVQLMMTSSFVELVPVSVQLANRAAVISAENKIRGCDAIYVALAEALNEDLITWDKQQRERAKTLVNAYHL